LTATDLAFDVSDIHNVRRLTSVEVRRGLVAEGAGVPGAASPGGGTIRITQL